MTRRFEIDAGHRLLWHEGKCRHLHGHRYVFDVTCEADALDDVGRVVDFSVVKARVGAWLDDKWDHGTILNIEDPLVPALHDDGTKLYLLVGATNPTAENLAAYLHHEADMLLRGYGVRVVRVRCWETPNCWAEYP